MPIVLQIESKVDYLLCLESVVVCIVPLFIIVHLFVDMLLFIALIATLMWLVSIVVITNLMLDQSNPHVIFQLCVPYFVSTFLFI
jgi:hypothetical protein